MASANLGSPLKATVRLAVYGALTIFLMPVQLVAVILDLRLATRLPLWYHKRCCRILGLRIERHGVLSQARPTLFVSNHVSYFDIVVYSAMFPCSFVAKAQVAQWPLFGWLAKLQRTVFIERRGPRSLAGRDEMAAHLGRGDNLILFPEGTSSDGNRVLPFKSALLSVAEKSPRGQALVIQPVSIAYTRLDGVPMGRYLRPLIAWYGDMDLASHLWHAAGLGIVTVIVEFHEPVVIDDFASRKDLAEHCQQQVATGVTVALTGRTRPAPRRQPLLASS